MQIIVRIGTVEAKASFRIRKKKNSAKIQINMTPTGVGERDKNLHLESEKDSSIYEESSGRMDDIGVIPYCQCRHAGEVCGTPLVMALGVGACGTCGCMYRVNEGTCVRVSQT